MPNHVHLVMVPDEEDGLRATLGETHRRYTRYVNFRKGWRGHLWQERFHSFVMDEKYFLATVRYVERNPVVARLCQRAFEWEWSSALAHLKGSDDVLVRVKPMLELVDDWSTYLSDTGRSEIDDENRIERHTRTGRPLGNEHFISKLEVTSGRELSPRNRGRKPKQE